MMKKKLMFLFLILFVAVGLLKAKTFYVTVPSGTKECYIAGEFTGWSHQKMDKVAGVSNRFTITIATTNEQRYKYCSGPNWAYEELNANGFSIANRATGTNQAVNANDQVVCWQITYDPNAVRGNIMLTVNVPANTPKNNVYLFGAFQAVSWDATAAPQLTMVSSTKYTYTFTDISATAFKMLCGQSDVFVETTGPNRVVTYTGEEGGSLNVEMTVPSWNLNSSCGDNLTWNINRLIGTLTIRGTGAMTNFVSNHAPWYVYLSDIIDLKIEEGATHIGNNAFWGCENIESAILPESVTSMGDGAFSGCSTIASIKLPSKLSSINQNVFFNCTNLASITIPDNVTSIGAYAFSRCTNLTSVIIPELVTFIGGSAFENCVKLTSIINRNPISVNINSTVFYNVNKNACTLKVPASSVASYKATEGWKGFRIEAIIDDLFHPIEVGFNAIVGLSEVTFTNTSKYADEYEWDFGDGNTSTQVHPIHTYAAPGAYEVKLIAKNYTETDSVMQYVEIEGIKKITNNKGGNGGFASFDIYGGGLDETALVKLVKGSETISTHTLYKKEPGIICATFDLTGKNRGFYDIVIIANGKTYTIANGFEIEEEGWPEAWSEIEGNNVFIPGRWQTYTVHYGNAGNADIYGLPINLFLGNNSELEILFDLIDTVGGESTDINDPDNFLQLTSLYSQPFTGKMYSVLIPHIPANTSGSFSFRLKINVSTPTHIFVTTGEILNDVYFNAQEDEYGTDIFGYELTDNFLIKKEALSQLIRNEIDKSFSFSQNSSKKQWVNFLKLLNNSNCFNSSLRAEKPPVGGVECCKLDDCTTWSRLYKGVQFRYCRRCIDGFLSQYWNKVVFHNNNDYEVKVDFVYETAEASIPSFVTILSKRSTIGNKMDKATIRIISVTP